MENSSDSEGSPTIPVLPAPKILQSARSDEPCAYINTSYSDTGSSPETGEFSVIGISEDYSIYSDNIDLQQRRIYTGIRERTKITQNDVCMNDKFESSETGFVNIKDSPRSLRVSKQSEAWCTQGGCKSDKTAIQSSSDSDSREPESCGIVKIGSNGIIGECSQEVMSILGKSQIKRPTPTKARPGCARNGDGITVKRQFQFSDKKDTKESMEIIVMETTTESPVKDVHNISIVDLTGDDSQEEDTTCGVTSIPANCRQGRGSNSPNVSTTKDGIRTETSTDGARVGKDACSVVSLNQQHEHKGRSEAMCYGHDNSCGQNCAKSDILIEKTSCEAAPLVVPSTGWEGRSPWKVKQSGLHNHKASRFDFLHSHQMISKDISTEEQLLDNLSKHASERGRIFHSVTETSSKLKESNSLKRSLYQNNHDEPLPSTSGPCKSGKEDKGWTKDDDSEFKKSKKEKFQVSLLVRRLNQRKAQGVMWNGDEDGSPEWMNDWCLDQSESQAESGNHGNNPGLQSVLDIELSEVMAEHQVAALKRGRWILDYSKDTDGATIVEQNWDKLKPLIQDGKLPSCTSCLKREETSIWVYCYFSQALQVYDMLKGVLNGFTRPADYLVPGHDIVLTR